MKTTPTDPAFPPPPLFSSEITINPNDPEIMNILGCDCVMSSQISRILRARGYIIRHKIEAEQAYVISWMLSLYREHGMNWRECAQIKLEEMKATLARLADAATPGPWIKSTRGCEAMISTKELGFLFPALGNSEGAHHDAEFIAAANPSKIKSPLARIHSLEIEAKSWEQQAEDRVNDANRFLEQYQAEKARADALEGALDAAKKSLASIRQLSLGPDKGSIGWQAEHASELSEKGLKEINAILGGENAEVKS